MSTPTVWTEAPAHQPRSNTLLDLIEVRPFPDGRPMSVDHYGDNCAFPTLLPQECYINVGAAQGTDKDFDGYACFYTSETFGVFSGIECYLNGDLTEQETLTRNRLENGASFVIESIVQGAVAAGATSAGAATSVVAALALLEDVLGLNVNAQGIIWMSPGMATTAAAENLLIRDALSGNLTTYVGTPVVVSGAFPSTAMYATGPVHLWGSDVVYTEAPAQNTNRFRTLAERIFALDIECGAWSVASTSPTNNPPPPPPVGEDLVMTLGSIPSSPIPDGTDTTIIVHTNVAPTDEVYLWFAVNGGAHVLAGEMTQTGTLEFVWNVQGDQTTTGDSVEVWSVSLYGGVSVESNHITIEVT